MLGWKIMLIVSSYYLLMVVLDIQNIAEKGISDYVNKFLKASML